MYFKIISDVIFFLYSQPDKKNAKKLEADSSESDDEEDELQKFLEGEDIDTDENDESFKVNTSGEARYEKKYILTKII